MSVSWCIQYGQVIQMNIIQNESKKEHFSMKRRVIKKSEKTGFTLQIWKTTSHLWKNIIKIMTSLLFCVFRAVGILNGYNLSG